MLKNKLSFFLFFFVCLGPHRAVFRSYSWLCAWESFLALLTGTGDWTWVCCMPGKHCSYYAIYSSGPSEEKFIFSRVHNLNLSYFAYFSFFLLKFQIKGAIWSYLSTVSFIHHIFWGTLIFWKMYSSSLRFWFSRGSQNCGMCRARS